MINLKEDFNAGFSEIYKEIHHIIDPVIVTQLKAEEI